MPNQDPFAEFAEPMNKGAAEQYRQRLASHRRTNRQVVFGWYCIVVGSGLATTVAIGLYEGVKVLHMAGAGAFLGGGICLLLGVLFAWQWSRGRMSDAVERSLLSVRVVMVMFLGGLGAGLGAALGGIEGARRCLGHDVENNVVAGAFLGSFTGVAAAVVLWLVWACRVRRPPGQAEPMNPYDNA